MKNLLRAGVVVAATLAFYSSALAQEAPVPQITVTGNGEVRTRPDMAVVSFGVQKVAKTAREAVSANNEAMNKVIALLKEAGVEDKDIQTSGFSIYPQFDYKSGSRPEGGNEIVGYQVRNALSVRVMDLSKLGGLLDSAVDAGLNEGGQINFTNQNLKSLEREAQSAAVKDAMEKVQLLAEAAGVKVGKIISINEGGISAPQPKMAMRATFEAAPSDVPVESGENAYGASVSVTVAIEE